MLRDTLDTLADLWSLSTERRDLTSRMGGVYRNEWRDAYGTHILASEIEKRYPHTAEMLLAVADTSVNAFRWACGKLGAIYDRAPSRKLNGADCPTLYDSWRINLGLAQACKLTWALRQTILRPVLAKDGLSVQILSPEWAVVIPSRDNPMRLDAIMYQIVERVQRTNFVRYVAWTPEHHGIYMDQMLSSPLRIQGNEGNVNPYKVVPFILAHAEWPTAWEAEKILEPRASHGLYRATVEAAIGFTHLRHVLRWASHRQVAFKGIPGKDFDPAMIHDPANPWVVGPNATIEVHNFEVEIDKQVEAVLKLLDTPLNLEGIRPELIRGFTTATSGIDRRLQMTDLEERREDARTMWRINEDALYDVAREVVAVEKDRVGLKHHAPLPPGGVTLDYAEIGPGMGMVDALDYWRSRISAGLATPTEAIMALDDVSREEAEEKAAEAALARAQADRLSGGVPPSEVAE